jgi:hypothetical protein
MRSGPGATRSQGGVIARAAYAGTQPYIPALTTRLIG